MKIDQAKTRETPSDLSTGRPPSKRLSVFSNANRSEIVYLRVEQLIPYSKQARKIFDDDALATLADSIRQYGVRQPLTVLRTDSESPVFEVVSGERRLRAAGLANLQQVPCIVLRDASQAEEIALIENIQRQDLHPVELAKSLQELTRERGWGGQKEIREKLGLSASQISELLKINSLPESVKEAMLKNNFRGRERYRKLFTFTSEQKQLSFVNDHKLSKTASTEISLLRVLWSGDQKTPRMQMKRNITYEQKMHLLTALQDVITDLKQEI